MTDTDSDSLDEIDRPWSDADTQHLAEVLRDGADDQEAASALRRSVRSVRRRADRMIPDAGILFDGDVVPADGDERWVWLLRRTNRGSYDWRAVMADNAYRAKLRRSRGQWPDRAGTPWTEEDCEVLITQLRAGLMVEDIATLLQRTPLRLSLGGQLWWATEDAALRSGWEQSTPLPQLASQLQRPEHHIAYRLIDLGCAQRLLEVTDRLGCSPRGIVDLRRRRVLNDASTVVQVLLGHDAADNPVHVSLHPDTDAALHKAADVDEARHRRGEPPLTWFAGPRQIGSDSSDAILQPLAG